MASEATLIGVEFQIELYSKRPAYLQLADQIRAQITSGELKAGDKIPSLHQLAEMSGLSMGTVQKAVRSLEMDNLVFTVVGRGAFVTPRNIDAP